MQSVKRRPAGTTAALVPFLVVLAELAGLDLTAIQAASLVGGLAWFVSLFHPLPEA